MDVSPNILRQELVQLIEAIDKQIKEAKEEAMARDIPAEKLRDHHGNWIMVPLLLAKVQAVAAMVQLNQRK